VLERLENEAFVHKWQLACQVPSSCPIPTLIQNFFCESSCFVLLGFSFLYHACIGGQLNSLHSWKL